MATYDAKDFGTSIKCHLTNCITVHTENCENQYSMLHNAVDRGDAAVVKACVEILKQERVSFQDYRPTCAKKLTTLQVAVRKEPLSVEVVQELLKLTDASLINSSHVLVTALETERTGQNQYKLIQLLVAAGAQVNREILGSYLLLLQKAFDSDYWIPIFELLASKCTEGINCCHNGHPILHQFLDRPAVRRTGLKPIKEMWPITEAQILQVIEKLLNSGVDISRLNHHDESLLHIAVRSENYAVCKLLIDAGVNGNVNGLFGGNALGQISDYEPPFSKNRLSVIDKIVHLLVTAGKVDINMKGLDGLTVLHRVAASFHQLSVIRILVQHGADIRSKDMFGNTLIHSSTWNSTEKPLKYFLEMNVIDVNSRNVDEFAALHYACMQNDHVKVNILLKSGADVHLRTKLGATALHVSAVWFTPDECGEKDCLKLLHAGLDINSTDDYHRSALHCSVLAKNTLFSRMLREQGIDESLIDSKGFTATDYSEQNVTVRPVDAPEIITLEELDDYTEMICAFLRKQTWFNPRDISISFLSQLDIQAVDQENDENQMLKNEVEEFFKDVIESMGELDWGFQGRLVCSGSSYEGVKIERPDEFDYMVELPHFSAIARSFQSQAEYGFVSIQASDRKSVPKEVQPYINTDGKISSEKILVTFKRLFHVAVMQAHAKPRTHIVSIPGSADKSMPLVGKSTLVCHNLLWISQTYQYLHISVDVNPVLFINKWPADCRSTSHLHPTITELGVYVIPKVPIELSDDEAAQELWRLSFSRIELTLLQSLSRSAVDGYILAKAIRMSPICPRLTSDPQHHTGSDTSSENEESTDDQDDEPTFVRDIDNFSPLIQTATAEGIIKTYYLKQLFYGVIDDFTQNETAITPVGIIQSTIAMCKNRLQTTFIACD